MRDLFKRQHWIYFCWNCRSGSRPMQSMQMHRSEKMTDAFIGQIFTANNNEKQHFLRKHKAYNAQNSTKLTFPRNEYETFPNLHLKDLFSQKLALALFHWHSRLWNIPRCFKIYYSVIFMFIFWNIVEFIFDFDVFSNVHVLNVFMRSNIM